MTKDVVNKLVKDFLLSGTRIAKEDEDDGIVKTLIAEVQSVINAHMPEIRRAANEYMTTEDLDALILALLPAHDEIWYRAYGPYWVKHCKPDDSDPAYTFYNDLIGMYWDWRHQLWRKKDEICVTIMLPPTRGLIDFAFREAQQSLKEYLEKQADKERKQSTN